MELTPSELVQPLIEHINRVIAERNKLREENATLRHHVGVLRQLIADLLEANRESADLIANLREENASLQGIVNELREENNEAFDRILELTKQVSDAHEEIHTLEADLSRLSDELKLLRGIGKLPQKYL